MNSISCHFLKFASILRIVGPKKSHGMCRAQRVSFREVLIDDARLGRILKSLSSFRVD